MIEVIQKPSVRKADKPDVVMSRMDYVIICQVVEQLNKIGMTPDELSFLLGKANNYVFGFILKPSDKNRFTEDQIDLLPFILQCSFGDIIPSGTPAGDIHLCHTTAIDDDGYKGFSHIIYSPTGEGTRIIWKKKKARKGSTRKTNEALLALLKSWVNDGYFDQERDGLEIYKKLNAETTIPFRIDELEKCLKTLTGIRHKLLHRASVDGILKYGS